jgi:phosphoribosylformylglycinamidine synthase
MKPKVIIPTKLGINSQEELKYCFELAGATAEYVPWKVLIANPDILDDYQGAGMAGGFAMGDRLGAGQSLANRIRLSPAYEKLREKIEDSSFPMYIVCNSLQALAKLDFLPIRAGTAKNASGKHETSFWDLKVNPKCDTVRLIKQP